MDPDPRMGGDMSVAPIELGIELGIELDIKLGTNDLLSINNLSRGDSPQRIDKSQSNEQRGRRSILGWGQ